METCAVKKQPILVKMRASSSAKMIKRSILLMISGVLICDADEVWLLDRGKRDLEIAKNNTLTEKEQKALMKGISEDKSAAAKFVWLKPGWYLIQMQPSGKITRVFEWQPWSSEPNVIVPVEVEIDGNKIIFKGYPEKDPLIGIEVTSLVELAKQ